MAFTRDGEVSFQIPLNWPRTRHRTRRGRWLRVDVSADESYRRPPQIAAIELAHEWELPRAHRHRRRRQTPRAVRSYNDFTYRDDVATPFAPTADDRSGPLPRARPTLRPPTDRRSTSGSSHPDRRRSPPTSWQSSIRTNARRDRLGVRRAGRLAAHSTPRTRRRRFSASGLVSFAAPTDLAERSRFGHARLLAAGAMGDGHVPAATTTPAGPAQHDVGDPGGHRRRRRSSDRATAIPARCSPRPSAPSSTASSCWSANATSPTETWERWDAQPDLYDSGPRDRHYTIDALTGEIRFGDGSTGMIPPTGPEQRPHHVPHRRWRARQPGGGDDRRTEVGRPVRRRRRRTTSRPRVAPRSSRSSG